MTWRDYETMARPGPIEYGAAVSFNWRPEEERREIRRLSAGQKLAVGGYATFFKKPHPYKGGVDVFMPGCFAKTLIQKSDVRLLCDHNEYKLLAVTGEGLNIWADDVGLSFKVLLPDNEEGRQAYADVKSGAKSGVSVGYHLVDTEMKTIEGHDVRLIHSARLGEISLVKKGAVKEAFAVCLDDDDRLDRPYALTKSQAGFESAAVRFRETLHELQKAVAERYA
ncbi:HK97 family phage prohead protease [Bradyrhizobium yuanmingense]|uniref:HK97 family phage prohead protease n=1 Tax=Bradyrhizobium yuanmingense TaxID=108015 RepID=UPI0023B95890|nr:HK97 family phage prohead protease [Bradyrhizobium yuanmingense]MDF0581262.1 HK97 family phage prohead protease [Bradyrhizobium yuanmingense]